mgnify:CR=1 FL=1
MYKTTIFRRLMLVLIAASMATGIMSADIIHTVNRGETLSSIAQKYGVSEEKIIKANPQAAQFIYVGLELTIPTSSAPTSSPIPSTSVKPITESSENKASKPASASNSDDVYTPVLSQSDNKFSQLGVNYFANFKDDGKGYYGLFLESINEHGWGGLLSFNLSYGIIDDWGIVTRLGVVRGIRFGEHVYGSIPICLNYGSISYVSRMYYYEYKDKWVTNKDNASVWGLSLTPKMVFSYSKVHFNIGLDVNYFFKRSLKMKFEEETMEMKFGGKVNVGFFVALGF